MKTKKIISCIAAFAASALILTGCGESERQNQNSGTQAPIASQAASKLSGTITMSGSTSMEKLANALSESFMNENPNVLVTAEFVGSSAGIEAAAAKTVDIGNASRELKDSEKAQGVVENIVAIDGIAVVTDPSNVVDNLTKQQLTDIYTGTIKNWIEVGGADAAIVVVGREAGSGTRGAFEEILKIEDKCAYSNELDSTGAAMAKAGSTPGAIAYVSLDSLNDTVKTISLEGVEPTVENIKSGKYFLQRPFVMATVGEIEEQSELIRAWFDYIDSAEGKAIIEKVGLITK